MDAQRELRVLLGPWTAASAQVERAPGETCLTGDEIAAYLDHQLEADARSRAKIHLSRCSFCTREVGSLLRAAQEFEERTRVRRALGGVPARVGACLRLFVDDARGAFTRADALLQALSPSVRLEPMRLPGGLAWASARGEDDEDEGGDLDPDALREVTLHGEGLPGVEVLCGKEEGRGSLTVSLTEPWHVCLVGDDGSRQFLEVERGEDRYYASITGMPAGEYMVTLLPPGGALPNPP